MTMISNRMKSMALPLAIGLIVALAGPVSPAVAARGSTAVFKAHEPASQVTAPPQHEFDTKTHKVRGTFTCGELTLEIFQGTETETTDGDLRDGIARISISRTWRNVKLHGSDGRIYRAMGVTVAWFVFHAPDLEHPVTGLEVVQVVFRGGPDKSPGWLREKINIRNGHETDIVDGPCDFA